MTQPLEHTEQIVVVDDDDETRDLLKRYLVSHNYAVTAVAGGAELQRHFAEKRPDLVVLDRMLPGEDGLEIARRLRREHQDLGIIILSARGDTEDRVCGLEVGVDDYVAKPFNPRELVARIRAVLRSKAAIERSRFKKVLHFGAFTLDLAGRRLSRNGDPVTLTQGEFVLLAVMAERPGRILSRDYLVQNIKGYERGHDDRCIDVRVARLRRKIEEDPQQPSFIRTVRGVGYLFFPAKGSGG